MNPERNEGDIPVTEQFAALEFRNFLVTRLIKSFNTLEGLKTLGAPGVMQRQHTMLWESDLRSLAALGHLSGTQIADLDKMLINEISFLLQEKKNVVLDEAGKKSAERLIEQIDSGEISLTREFSQQVYETRKNTAAPSVITINNYRNSLNRFTALQELYSSFITQEDQPSITPVGVEVIKNTIKNSVTFIGQDDFIEKDDYFVDARLLENLLSKYKHCYKRFSSIGRLPNLLLFGSDTLGPDLVNEFAKLIDDPDSKNHILKQASKDFMGFRGMNTRNINYGDERIIQNLALKQEQTFYLWHPALQIQAEQFHRSERRFILAFYSPTLEANRIGHEIYVVPSLNQLEHIAISTKPFKLT